MAMDSSYSVDVYVPSGSIYHNPSGLGPVKYGKCEDLIAISDDS